MRTKLATLEVWLDDEPMIAKSSFDRSEKHGEIVISSVGSPNMPPISGPNELADILAHEIGHFVGFALNIPEQYASARLEASPVIQMGRMLGLPYPEQVIASETQAWDWAGKMRSVDPATRNKYLDSYKD